MKVALAYSGGLDTTVAIKWLQEKYSAEVIAVAVDVGQEEDFKAIEERALAAGAEKFILVDAKKRFAEEFIPKCIMANGLYEGEYPLSTALARPLIAEEVAKVALKEGVDAVAHGCTGKGNDQIRMDASFSVLLPDVKIIAPIREWNMSRDQEIEYAKKHGLPLDFRESRFSIDDNLWGRSIEAAELEDPWIEPPWEAFKYISPPSEWPDDPDEIVIGFENGCPNAINGRKLGMEELIREINSIAGRHGFGIVDHIEDRVIGLKSREVYEVPAALTLIKAHMDLEKMALGKRFLEFKRLVDSKWADLVYSGLWHDRLREALDAFIECSQEGLTGEVRIRFYKGSMRILGRRCERSLYSKELITYSKESMFDQRDGESFSKLWTLEMRLQKLAKSDRIKGED